jgi:exodeoxyribonuclease-5
MTWSPQQDGALKAVARWLENSEGQQVFRLFGYAGTGKTTLAKHLAADVFGDVVFGAFTGKAALVLRNKGCFGATTIHSMIYKVRENSRGIPTFHLDNESVVRDCELVIIDECSMVGEELARDLLSFNKPVLVLGDPAQLPPVKDAGFFTNCEPDFMLTEVHRQARDNPIIHMAMTVREGATLVPGCYGESRVIRKRDNADSLQRDVLDGQVLVGRNVTRRLYNRRIRQLLGREGAPQVGDRLVCLRNNHEKGLLNGGLWTAAAVKTRKKKSARNLFTKPIFDMEIDPEDAGMINAVKVSVPENFFDGTEHDLPWKERRNFDEFDFGYALTTHKAQGSQWPNVVVFDESHCFQNDAQRWLYTALTRAAEKVTVVQ